MRYLLINATQDIKKISIIIDKAYIRITLHKNLYLILF